MEDDWGLNENESFDAHGLPAARVTGWGERGEFLDGLPVDGRPV